MGYINRLNQIKYIINNKNIDILNLFERISFDSFSLNNKQIFSDYYLIDGDTIENISEALYGSVDFYWVILLANNIISPFELPQSEEILQNIINTKYNGKAIFSADYLKGLKEGDIIVKATLDGGVNVPETQIASVDTASYAIIKNYDPFLRRILVEEINGTISQASFIGIYSLDNNNNWVPFQFNVKLTAASDPIQRNFTTARKIIDYPESPYEFLDANGNYVSPYSKNDNVDLELSSTALGSYAPTDPLDLNTISNTNLFSYMRERTVSYESIKTIRRKLIDDNSKFRIIKILNPNYLSEVVSETYSLLADPTQKTKIISFNGNVI